MSKKSKISFLIAFLLLVATFMVQFMTGMWLNLNSVLLGVAAGCVVLAIIFDYKLYWEFLTMRTTKHGMNMGLMILLVVTFLVCINYLANKHNKTWDLTQEKLNSLSEQSVNLLKELKDDLEIKVFYKGPQAQDDRQKVKQALSLFQDASGKVKVRYINAYVDQQLAIQYLKDYTERDTAGVISFIEYSGKKIAVDDPFTEAGWTSAMIKATREGATKIYFVQGHGEKDIHSDDDSGLREFSKALGDASFQTEPINLLDKKEIPEDAAAVAIIGPTVPYLENELQTLREYLERGGRLFLALDPGVRHNLANLTKTMGVQFANNYVLSMLQIVGQGPVTVIGRTFDATSDVTKSFRNDDHFAVFPIVSEVTPAPDKSSDIEVREIVKSDARSFTMNDLKSAPSRQPDTKSVTVGVDVKGKLKSDGKSFKAVIFGDSDFFSNRAIFLGVNRDLAMNALAGLTDQKDLLSIRPKLPKGTMVVLTHYSRLAIIITLMALPLALLVTGGVLWFRRRGA